MLHLVHTRETSSAPSQPPAGAGTRRERTETVRRQTSSASGAPRSAEMRLSLWEFARDSNYRNLLTIPVIYSLVLPLALLDLWVTLYQWVCFPVFGVARVQRGRYFVFDRHRLAYLTAIERVHCHYCSYANGVVAYVREIAARTETYWCPIKHDRAVPEPHRYYRDFFEYGDGAAYRSGLTRIRSTLSGDSRQAAWPRLERR